MFCVYVRKGLDVDETVFPTVDQITDELKELKQEVDKAKQTIFDR